MLPTWVTKASLLVTKCHPGHNFIEKLAFLAAQYGPAMDNPFLSGFDKVEFVRVQ